MKRRFALCLLLLFLVGAVAVCTVRGLGWNTTQAQLWERIAYDAATSCANTGDYAPETRQLATVFHTEAQLALLDDSGAIIAQTAEYLLLCDGAQPVFARLRGLSDADRDALRETAMVEPEPLSHDFPAVRYERYPYSSVVSFDDLSSRVVTKPVTLQPVGDATGDMIAVVPDANGTLETRAWLPYLRDEGAPDGTRLAALLAGDTPDRLPWRCESFALTDAPEGSGAARLAIYYRWSPLSFFPAQAGTLVTLLVIWAVLSAALSLAVCAVVERVRKSRTNS